MINVNFSNDPDYRYKMPAPQLQNIGGGNGKRFLFTNISAVSQKIFRNPEILQKYLQTEFGAFGALQSDGSLSLTGWQDVQSVLDKIKNFIFNYVLCKHCGNPETVEIIEPSKITFKCKACGKDSTIEVSSDVHPIIAWQCKQSRKQNTLQRNRVNPLSIRGKIEAIIFSDLQDKNAVLTKEINNFIDTQSIVEEEFVPILLAALNAKKVMEDAELTLLKTIALDRKFNNQQQLQILFSLECVFKQFEADFHSNKVLISSLFQKLLQQKTVDLQCFLQFREAQGQQYVPEEYHQAVLAVLEPFYNWFDQDDEEVVEEVIEIEEVEEEVDE